MHEQGDGRADLRARANAFWKSARPDPGDKSRHLLVSSPRLSGAPAPNRATRATIAFPESDPGVESLVPGAGDGSRRVEG